MSFILSLLSYIISVFFLFFFFCCQERFASTQRKSKADAGLDAGREMRWNNQETEKLPVRPSSPPVSPEDIEFISSSRTDTHKHTRLACFPHMRGHHAHLVLIPVA